MLEPEYVPPMFLICPRCTNKFAGDEVETTDICEDMQGRDLVTFKCNECRESVQSYVLVG